MATLDKGEALSRIKALEESSSEVIRRLEQRAETLERDVRPVHEGTRQLYAAHTNLGRTVEYIEEVCDRVKGLVRLQEQLGGEVGDWDRFMASVVDVTDSLAHFQSQPALAKNELLTSTFLEVRSGALAALEGEYVRVLHDLHDTRASDQTGAGTLLRLRRALTAAESDSAFGLFVQVRSEALLASAEEMRLSFAATEVHDTMAHPLVHAPTLIVSAVQFERALARAALEGDGAGSMDLEDGAPGVFHDHLDALQAVLSAGIPAMLGEVERAVAYKVEQAGAREAPAETVCATAALLMALHVQVYLTECIN